MTRTKIPIVKNRLYTPILIEAATEDCFGPKGFFIKEFLPKLNKIRASLGMHEITQPALSQFIKNLEINGYIDVRRKGKFKNTHCYLNVSKIVDEFMKYYRDYFDKEIKKGMDQTRMFVLYIELELESKQREIKSAEQYINPDVIKKLGKQKAVDIFLSMWKKAINDSKKMKKIYEKLYESYEEYLTIIKSNIPNSSELCSEEFKYYIMNLIFQNKIFGLNLSLEDLFKKTILGTQEMNIHNLLDTKKNKISKDLHVFIENCLYLKEMEKKKINEHKEFGEKMIEYFIEHGYSPI